jgi:hypothetical protein
MNAAIGWGLAVLAVAIGYVQWDWQGVALAVTMVAFWMLLQFSRAMRAMRAAAQAPVGHVDSALMLHAKMRKGMRLVDILPLTRSLGRKLAEEPETYVWADASGARVTVVLRRGRCSEWRLERPDTDGSAQVLAEDGTAGDKSPAVAGPIPT